MSVAGQAERNRPDERRHSRYTYDSAGYPASVKDALTHITTMQNDLRGRLTQQQAADSGISSFQYDPSATKPFARTRSAILPPSNTTRAVG